MQISKPIFLFKHLIDYFLIHYTLFGVNIAYADLLTANDIFYVYEHMVLLLKCKLIYPTKLRI